MANIQTEAWHAWLSERGVSREDIITTLDADEIAARELRLRQSLTQVEEDAVLYLGAYSTEGPMVGFAKFFVTAEEESLVMHLAEIDVLPDYQGKKASHPDDQNLARKLIYAAIAHVRDPEAVLRLEVLGDNTRARRLYEHLGLHVVNEDDTFSFNDAVGNVTAEVPYVHMRGSLQDAKRILTEDLAVV